MLEWKKHRDEITCEIIHTLYDEIKEDSVVVVRKVGSRYRVKILDHVPFHTATLKVALQTGKHVYEYSVPG